MESTRLRNVRVWVGDGSWRDALTIVGGTVAAAGRGREIDLGGRVVTPGLVDAHVHLVLGALSRRGIDLSGAGHAGAMVDLLLEAQGTGRSESWLIAHSWDETGWDEAAVPSKTLLEPLGEQPVVCWRRDLHAALVNQAVLDRLDLPPGATGAATGLLVEDEAWDHLQPSIPEPSLETSQAALADGVGWLNALGVTAVRTMEYRRILESVMDPMAGQLNLRMAVTLLDRTLPLDLDWVRLRDPSLPPVIGCKAFLDGTLGSRTARMHEPFLDRGDCGRWVELAADDSDGDWCDAVLRAGLAPSVHAIGDAAVERAARLLARAPDERRATIEHAQILPEGMLDEVAAIRLSVQPVHRAEDLRSGASMLGTERAARMLPLQSLQRAGARLAFGTDWPVSGADPMETLRAAITGETIDGVPWHVEEAIDNESALHAMTLGASEAVSLPGAQGLLEGEVADLVVWDGDPLTWNGRDPAPEPALVLVNGRCAYGDGLR